MLAATMLATAVGLVVGAAGRVRGARSVVLHAVAFVVTAMSVGSWWRWEAGGIAAAVLLIVFDLVVAPD
jgi:hypothetical protein